MKTVAIGFALLGLCAALRGQTAPGAVPMRAAHPSENAPVVLNVFQVVAEAEDEYRAANTTTGTRYSTPVKDLPMQIEVLTEAFIRDVGATDVRQALEYVSGVQLETSVANSSRDNPENAAMFVRGVTVATTMKDGFQHYLPIDAVTIGRIDIIKGPGGALYGQGNLGGVIQAGSIRAKDHPTVRFGATLGNFGYSRTELVWSGPLDAKKQIGLALPIAYQRNESSVMYYKTDNFVFNPALTLQIGPKTTMLLSSESRFNTRASIRGFFLTDNNRAPNGSFYGTIIPNRAGTNRVLTTPNQRDFRFEGPDTYRRERDYVRTFRVDHVFTPDLQLWAGYSYELTHTRLRDWNIALRNANDASIPLSIRTNPRFTALLRPTFNNAQPQLLDIRPNNTQNDFVTTRPTFKAELYYGFRTGPIQHRLVAGSSYGCTTQGSYTPNTSFYFGNTGTPADAITRAWEALPADVILSRFRSPTDFTSVKRWDSALINQYPQGQNVVAGALPTRSVNYFYDRNTYINVQSTYFKGRLETILGVLDVRNDRQGRVFGADNRVLWAGPAPAGNPAGTPGGVMRPEPVKDQAPSGTIVWRPHDQVRIYANAMSAVDPGPAYSAYDGNGQPLDAPVVTNREAGLRVYLFDSKVSFSAAFFEMTRHHNPLNLPGAIQNLSVAAASGAALTSGFSAFVKADSASTGYDLKLDYLPRRNLRINLGFTRNNARITAIEPFVTPNNPNPVFLAAQQRFLAAGGNARSYLGTSPEDLSKLTGTGYIRYEFSAGRLRGFWALAGSKYAGPRNGQTVTINTTTGDATITNTHVDPHFIHDLNLGYRHKFGHYLCDTKLGVTNILDDQDFYGATWQAPRTVRSSFTVNF